MATEKSRSWILTLPADEYDKDYVTEKLSKYTYIGQLELGGKTEYLHWQVYIENPTQIKFTTLRNRFPKGHFEPRKGTKKQAYEYVTKSDTSQGVTISNGEIDTTERQGERTDIMALRSAILFENMTADDLLLTEPNAARYSPYLHELEQIWKAKQSNLNREVSARYIWGPAGCGKTRYAHELYANEEFYRVTNYLHPWDSYNGQKTLVLDEFRGQIEFSFMLNVLDRYKLELPCRYRNKWATWTTVLVLSNIPLTHQYPDARGYNFDAFSRRFESVEMMDMDGTLTLDNTNVRR